MDEQSQDLDLLLFNARSVKVSNSAVNDFAWIPATPGKDVDTLYLVSTGKEMKLSISTVPLFRPASFSVRGSLAFSGRDSVLILDPLHATDDFGSQVTSLFDVKNFETSHDSSQIIYQRAKCGYLLDVK